jgi:hypothetical protein
MAEHPCHDPACELNHDEPDGDETTAGAEALAEAAVDIAHEETLQRQVTEEGTSEQARIHEEAETERTRIREEAETERARIEAETEEEIVEEVTDAAEAIAHEETEQVEALAGALGGEEEPEPEPELGAEEELPAEAEPAPQSSAAEPVAVAVPPQLAEEAGERGQAPRQSRRTNAFRARRVRHGGR